MYSHSLQPSSFCPLLVVLSLESFFLSWTRSQLPKIIFQFFESLRLQGNLPFVKKGESSRVKFKGCAIQDANPVVTPSSVSGIFLSPPSQEVLSSSSGSSSLTECSLLVLPSCISKKNVELFVYLLPLTPSHFLFLLLPLLNSTFI